MVIGDIAENLIIKTFLILLGYYAQGNRDKDIL